MIRSAEKPARAATREAMAALTTDMQLLIPQAQGICCGEAASRNLNPKGNGIPIKKPGNARHNNSNPVLLHSGRRDKLFTEELKMKK